MDEQIKTLFRQQADIKELTETVHRLATVLEKQGIPYTAHAYPADGPIDGVSVANYLGQDLEPHLFRQLL